MSKTGWQIATAVCGSLALMMGALAFNTSRALEVANAQLRKPAPIAVFDVADARMRLPVPAPSHICVDGTVFMRVGDQYLSKTDDGTPIAAPCVFVTPE